MSIKDKKDIKVYVGISGGVDSSVAAALLKEEGYTVTGVFIKIWHKELSQCDWRAEMQDAMRVCAHLDIPFLMIDLSDVYATKVIEYMVTSYARGLTPNPDVMCNSVVKFGAFYEWAIAQGADYVATGHYAQRNVDGELLCANDAAKDQSYFLWSVPQDRLKRTLFPVGAFPKKEVRMLAKKFGLPTASKPDSQGLCFIGDVDLKTFLSTRIDIAEGDVLDMQGNHIGTHRGAVLYTTGERHGFTVANAQTNQKPLYVVSRNIEKNTITVSPHPAQDVVTQNIFLTDIVIRNPHTLPVHVDAVMRYHGERVSGVIELQDGAVLLRLSKPVSGVSAGQSAVFYCGDTCIGGGTIVVQ